MRTKTQKLTQMALLIALLAILAFTPLGFVMIPPIAITIMHIPVIIGAITLGPVCGGILGACFGIFSMLKATFSAASPADMLFSPFISGHPFYSIIMCIVPRILLGVIAGVLFMAFSKMMKGSHVVPCLVSSLIATLCHSLMVLGCMSIFFSYMPLAAVFTAILALNGIVEIVAAVVISTAVCKPLLMMKKRGGR